MRIEDDPGFKLINAQLPRIAEKLKLFWGCPEFGPFIDILLKDTRDGTRRGFPMEVAGALLRLAEDHDFDFPEFRAERADAGGIKSNTDMAKRRSQPKANELAEALHGSKGKAGSLHTVPSIASAGQQNPDEIHAGEEAIADVSILCADLGFADSATVDAPGEVLDLLHKSIFSRFDRFIAEAGLERIPTPGDGLMVAGGAPHPEPDHLQRAARLALAMRNAVDEINAKHGTAIVIRIGLHAGPVTAGYAGAPYPVYHLRGETVDLACRLAAKAVPGGIHVSGAVHQRLKNAFGFNSLDSEASKGIDVISPYFLEGERESARPWWKPW